MARLAARMHDGPQYPTQGAVLFVDLERREHFSKYLSVGVLRSFLSGRGANMFLLHNLLLDGREPLDPQIPMIFGSGVFTGTVPSAARGNLTSVAPDSNAILDSNCGDFFPAFLKLNGYDHLVLYGQAAGWILLEPPAGRFASTTPLPTSGWTTPTSPGPSKRISPAPSGRTWRWPASRAPARTWSCAPGSWGPKAIFARCGTGAKMGSLRLKAVMILGRGAQPALSPAVRENNRELARKILATSVVKYALKRWAPLPLQAQPHPRRDGDEKQPGDERYDTLDADNFDVYRPGMDGCYQCPIRCRPLNDLTPEGKGGWGADALKG